MYNENIKEVTLENLIFFFISLCRDRIWTANNVNVGDAFGAGIVEHLSCNDLMSMDFMQCEDAVPLEPYMYEQYTPKNEEANDVRASDASLGGTNF